ncbi:MAG: glycosyltransferase [Thermoanaerobaculia bacterium]
MRFLFSVQPAAGHLQPLTPIGRELRSRGHEVAVVCSPSFAPAVEELGLPAIPLGLDWLRAEPERTFPALHDIAPGERYAWILANVYGDAAARRLIPGLLELFESWRPDVVIRDQMEFGSWLVAEKTGIPHVSYGYGLGFQEPDQIVLRPILARLRGELGLAPDPMLDTIFRHLRLEFAPRSYLGGPASGDAVRRHVRHHPIDGGDETPVPDWIGGLGSRPVVVATLGTNYNRTPGVFETIIEALAGEPLDLVVTIGRNRDPRELGAPPANVRIEQYVPLSQLLPHADVTICHAGFNTIFTAVAAGTPLVLIPIDSDQPAGALRCRDLGLGPMLNRRQLTPALVRDAVRSVLHESRYGDAVAAFRREMEALPGTAETASLLESLAVTGRGRNDSADAATRREARPSAAAAG